jgi:hypothetical protein
VVWLAAWLVVAHVAAVRVSAGRPGADAGGDVIASSVLPADRPERRPPPDRGDDGDSATADPNATATTAPAGPDDGRRREIVGFVLRGRNNWQRLAILDMEVIVDGKQRLLPLLHLLERLKCKPVRTEQRITFRFESGPLTVVDLQAGRVARGADEPAFPVLVAVSEIRQQQEAFVPVEAVKHLLDMKVTWNEMDYEFRATTTRDLRVWGIRASRSLLGIETEWLKPDLPEARLPAWPKKNALHFAELDFGARWRYRANERESSRDAHIAGPQQTLWGSLLNGRFKLRFSEPSFRLDERGHRFSDGPPVRLNWGEWRYRVGHLEAAVGDSVFGVNEITMPLIHMTGIRVNGILGRKYAPESDVLSYGLQPYFLQPHVFEGHARAGSTVRLTINGQEIGTQEVAADSPTKPGFGTYHFEDIHLTPGALHEVQIVITDPEGIETTVEREVLGSAALLGAGETAFLGGVGTRRDVNNWSTHGVVGLGRLLHGVTRRLTLGGSFAVHQQFYPANGDGDGTHRAYPSCGAHVGTQASWLAMDSLILSADLAVSHGEGEGDSYDDCAVKLKADWSPTRRLRFHGQVFSIGSDFFDGQHANLRDKRGAAVTGRWRLNRRWALSAAAGTVHNNLDGHADERLSVDFQSLRITTSALPRSTVSFEAERLDASWQQDPVAVYRLKVRATPLPNLDVYADITRGDELSLGEHADFLSGLRVPGSPSSRSRRASVTVKKTLSEHTYVGASYRRSSQRIRPTVFHAYHTGGKRRLQVRTELGWDYDRDEDKRTGYFENRTEYVLDHTGRNRVGVRTRLERENWTVLAFLDLKGLVAFDGAKPYYVSSRRINPDRGAVFGRVFVDYNANAVPDEGEPGVEGVRVRITRYYSTTTDKQGRFILPPMGRGRQFRVSLDMDTVPAIYNVSHGTQVVHLEPGALTEVNLGVTPMISVGGSVIVRGAGGMVRPLAGVRVYMVSLRTGQTVGDSVTASDGTYYLGEVHPGRFSIRVDTKTVPDNYRLDEPRRKLDVLPQKDWQEFKVPPFVLENGRGGKTDAD